MAPDRKKKVPGAPAGRRPAAGKGGRGAAKPPAPQAPAEPEVLAQKEDAESGEAIEPSEEEILAEAGGAEAVELHAPATAALAPRAEPGLVSRDPLQAYMAEVVKHPLLTREEEHALAVRYRA